MSKALLFIPDISGFTEFVNTTEITHSRHVVAELLELLIDGNICKMELAEIEGDALFFYKETDRPDTKELFQQIQHLYETFYRHLQLLDHHRICPCNACATAPNLKLKIIVHYGEIDFISVKNQRKPFGRDVIKVHRLLKNDVPYHNYLLVSDEAMSPTMNTLLEEQGFLVEKGEKKVDGLIHSYHYAKMDPDLFPVSFQHGHFQVSLEQDPEYTIEEWIDLPVEKVFEYLINYQYRHLWHDGVDAFEYNPEEVTRLGSPHVCVIGQARLNFEVVEKIPASGLFQYGERVADPPLLKTMYNIYSLDPEGERTRVRFEVYVDHKVLWKKYIAKLIVIPHLRKTSKRVLRSFKLFAESN